MSIKITEHFPIYRQIKISFVLKEYLISIVLCLVQMIQNIENCDIIWIANDFAMKRKYKKMNELIIDMTAEVKKKDGGTLLLKNWGDFWHDWNIISIYA